MPKKDESVHIDQSKYERIKIVGKDGKVISSTGNQDAVAMALLIAKAQGVEIDKIIKANKLGDKYDPAQWDNPGMLRMNVGGTLRAMVNKGEPVVIGDITVKKIDQKVTIPSELVWKPAMVKPAGKAKKKAA